MKAKTFIIIFLLILIGVFIMAGIVHKAVKASGEKGLVTEWNDDHEITDDVDVEQNQFLNNVIENRTDFPAGPVEGQIVYRSDLNDIYIWDGTNWMPAIRREHGQVSATNNVGKVAPLDTFSDMPNMSIAHNSKTGRVLVIFTATILPGGWTGQANVAEIKLLKDGGNVSGSLRKEYYLGDDAGGMGTCTIQTIDANAGNNTWKIQWRRSFGADDIFVECRVLSIIDI